jgi:hypothetical protein
LRAERDLPKQFKMILPVQPLPQKYFCFRPSQITGVFSAVPPHHEGRFAIVTDVRWDAVDADAPITNGAEADGKDVWS